MPTDRGIEGYAGGCDRSPSARQPLSIRALAELWRPASLVGDNFSE
ncbi:MAG: hypothetical protein ABI180_11705 [Microcoleus sp.]